MENVCIGIAGADRKLEILIKQFINYFIPLSEGSEKRIILNYRVLVM
jgi:hypothetical protein